MPTLILVRHGETDVIGKRLTGRITGIHINATGRNQANAIAEKLKTASIGAIFSSPLERAMETARPLSEIIGIPISPHSGLTEINFGAWQGRPYKQLTKLKLWETVHTSPSKVTFPAGESFISAQQRIVASLEEIASAMGESDLAVCFSHCDPIRLALAYFLNMALDDFQRLSVDPGSLSEITFAHGKPNLGQINYPVSDTAPFLHSTERKTGHGEKTD
jgi:probable phosphomutase (TIGR03848 family)